MQMHYDEREIKRLLRHEIIYDLKEASFIKFYIQYKIV